MGSWNNYPISSLQSSPRLCNNHVYICLGIGDVTHVFVANPMGILDYANAICTIDGQFRYGLT
jgi:hypothetical protein